MAALEDKVNRIDDRLQRVEQEQAVLLELVPRNEKWLSELSKRMNLMEVRIAGYVGIGVAAVWILKNLLGN